MEKPYEGRAIVRDNYGTMDIVIPVKRQIFVVLFLGFWLCGWLLGEGFAIGALFGFSSFGGGEIFVTLFMGVWLAGWTVGGLFAMRVFFWLLIGREVITVGQGKITISKKGMLFKKPKTYDLNEVKNMSVEELASVGNFSYGRRNSFAAMMNNGIISFDYGLKTVRFAGGIDAAEGKHILKEMRRKGYLYERNFAREESGHFY